MTNGLDTSSNNYVVFFSFIHYIYTAIQINIHNSYSTSDREIKCLFKMTVILCYHRSLIQSYRKKCNSHKQKLIKKINTENIIAMHCILRVKQFINFQTRYFQQRNNIKITDNTQRSADVIPQIRFIVYLSVHTGYIFMTKK